MNEEDAWEEGEGVLGGGKGEEKVLGTRVMRRGGRKEGDGEGEGGREEGRRERGRQGNERRVGLDSVSNESVGVGGVSSVLLVLGSDGLSIGVSDETGKEKEGRMKGRKGGRVS